MPKYEYACKSCSERLEVVQSFADGPLTVCPACGGQLRKVFSAPSIAFKGSGFYRTDNRKRRANSEPAKAEADSSSSDGGKAEPAKAETSSSKSDSAPAAETKPKAAEAKTA